MKNPHVYVVGGGDSRQMRRNSRSRRVLLHHNSQLRDRCCILSDRFVGLGSGIPVPACIRRPLNRRSRLK